ncbi:hypothetical protein [Niveibacterium sp. SC-1]|uniref:hypothetical protein n=1 Tax=Niveibacterium sp. SC-1 TaxID=3135646 RepID=UPI00311F5353
MDVLVIDIGGTTVKLWASSAKVPVSFDSGSALTPQRLVEQVLAEAAQWHYEVISLGYPGEVSAEGPHSEAGNLGPGWLDFDFEEAFGHPVRVANDAVLQALGAYAGGKMLFLGLGTGLGSALVAERVVLPMELGCLPYGPEEMLSDRLGLRGLDKYGEPAWQALVGETVERLRHAFAADYVVLGGGNAQRVEPLPWGVRRGGNDDAFSGGVRLWDELVEPHDQAPSHAWRVLR